MLIRGATSALGQAAVNLAAHSGARVIATTRNPQRAAGLEVLGAQQVLLETVGYVTGSASVTPKASMASSTLLATPPFSAHSQCSGAAVVPASPAFSVAEGRSPILSPYSRSPAAGHPRRAPSHGIEWR